MHPLRFALSFSCLIITGPLLTAQNTFPSSGNVGIGTTSPTNPLQIVTSSSTNPAFFQYTGGASNTAITVRNTTGSVNLGIGQATPHAYLWSSTGNLFIGNDGNPTLFVNGMGGGNVGINTTSPGFTLDVNGSMHTSNWIVVDATSTTGPTAWLRGMTNGDANLVLQGGGSQAYWISGSNGVLKIGNNGGVEPSLGVINIDLNGNMAVGGNTASNYKLDVYGSLRANQVVVNTSGADYVFDTTYRLPSLPSLESFIRSNHHLPGIEPAGQMQRQGLNLGDNQTLLLQKVEELTLYIIEQNKQMAIMQSQLDELKARLHSHD